MRIIGEIPHSDCKITLFSWNNRYLIKLEQGLLEQTFKVDQFELSSENDLSKIINEAFMQESLARFDSMNESLQKAMGIL
ncbi:MAG: hypothetical protein OEU76_08480 [Cyclobacteriaceae bacterium]|nr:hypothetical protein [Cyclobacteriaceae bacterium]